MIKKTYLKKFTAACLCTALTVSMTSATLFANEISMNDYASENNLSIVQEQSPADVFSFGTEPEEMYIPDEKLPEAPDAFSEETNSEDQCLPRNDVIESEDPSELFIDGDEFTDPEILSVPEVSAAGTLSGNCGDNGAPVFWELKDGTITISGEGPITDSYVLTDWNTGQTLESKTVPWAAYKDQIREVIVEEGVTKINRNAFIDCYNLEKVTIAGTVKTIRYNAFANAGKLKDITIEEGVEEIEDSVFYGSKITSISLPSSIKKIRADAFFGLGELNNIYINEGGIYQSINGILYSDNGKKLVAFPMGREGTFTVPDGVDEIQKYAFAGCGLTTVNFPDSVTEIADWTFWYCEKLVSLTFPPNLKTIRKYVCYRAKALSSVTIPSGVTEIQDGAFQMCDSLSSITLPKTVSTIGNAFPKTTAVTLLNPALEQQPDGTFVDSVKINIRGTDHYTQAFQVLDLVNEERSKVGQKPLIMDQGLLQTAMLRAAETVLLFDHTRPLGTDCYTANPDMFGENIACGRSTAAGVMEQWMNSPGHKSNILAGMFTTIGIGCVEYRGTWYWVQCFGIDNGIPASPSSYSDHVSDHAVPVKKDTQYYKAVFTLSASKLKIGETASIHVKWDRMTLDNSGIQVTSSDPSVCSVQDDGTLKALKEGKAVITIGYSTWPENVVTKEITVVSNSIKVTFNANGGQTTVSSSEVTYNSTFGSLPSPTRKGYKFDGWYTKKNGGTKVSSSSKVTQTQNITLYAHWIKITTSKAAITKAASRKAGEMSITIKTQKDVSGYQIVYATDKTLKKNKKSLIVSKNSATIKGLKKGKTYYVKVRAYKTDSAGKRVFGNYSAMKTVKVKK